MIIGTITIVATNNIAPIVLKHHVIRQRVIMVLHTKKNKLNKSDQGKKLDNWRCYNSKLQKPINRNRFSISNSLRAGFFGAKHSSHTHTKEGVGSLMPHCLQAVKSNIFLFKVYSLDIFQHSLCQIKFYYYVYLLGV